jgi:uncharacterized membrane protein YbhN (UPF0104 family)
MSRSLRLLLTALFTAVCGAYLLWKIDVSETASIVADADLGYFGLAAGLMIVTTVPMAWRWQRLLVARDVGEPLGWLTRAYFVSYTAGQVLPTSIGGDAVRIYETSRRHPGRLGLITGSVFLDRALGGVATLLLGGVGFALALGRYDVGAYLWAELVLVLVTAVVCVALFSRAVRRPLRWFVPLLRRVWLERPLRAVYEPIHAYRANGRLLLGLLAVSFAVQVFRILPVWLSGKAVGIDLSLRPYYVMGPLLFVVMLFPFTINGLAVREAFFVSFLGNLDIGADAAFAAGFLFYVVILATALPGLLLLAWDAFRGAGRPLRLAREGDGRVRDA